MAVEASGRSCALNATSREQVQAVTYLEFPLNSSLGHATVSANLSVGTAWDWGLTTGSCSTLSNVTIGLCQAFVEFQDYAYVQIYDVTSGVATTSNSFLGGSGSFNYVGHCISGSCSPWSNSSAASGHRNSTTRYHFHLHQTLLPAHVYELVFYLVMAAETWCSQTGSAILTGSHGFAEGELKADLLYLTAV